MSQQEIYEIFLKKFTEELLWNIKIRLNQAEQEKNEKTRLENSIESEKLRQKLSLYINKTPVARPVQIIQKTQPPIKPKTQEIKPVQQTTKVLPPIQKIRIETPLIKPGPGDVDFGRLMMLVRDQLVTHIDCPGENKDITIRKAGRTMKVELTLKKEEIEKIIQSFSDTAKIPLIEGMLKARHNGLEIIAVFSVNGSSFVLKRENQNMIIPQRNFMPMNPRPPINPGINPIQIR